MPTINKIGDTNIFRGPGFYGILKSAMDWRLHEIGYSPDSRAIRSNRPVIADIPRPPVQPTQLAPIFGGELPAFLFIIYGAGVVLDDPNISFDLDRDIQAAGLDEILQPTGYSEGQYDKVQPLDFCVITGRKEYKYLEDHMNIAKNWNPEKNQFDTTPRPPLTEQPNGKEDLFLSIIKHLGISGIIGSMYASEAMSWKEYLDCAVHFWLGDAARMAKELARLSLLLPRKVGRPLTDEKRLQIQQIAAGIVPKILAE